MLQKMEREVALQHDSLSRPAVALPPNSGRTFSALFEPQLFSRMVVGGTTLIAANTLIYEFVTWLPTLFVQQGLSIASSFKYFFLITMGAPVGAAIALTADSLGRKPAIIGASFMAILFGGIYPFIRDPALLPLIGFSWSSRFTFWSRCRSPSTFLSCSPPTFACAPLACATHWDARLRSLRLS